MPRQRRAARGAGSGPQRRVRGAQPCACGTACAAEGKAAAAAEEGDVPAGVPDFWMIALRNAMEEETVRGRGPGGMPARLGRRGVRPSGRPMPTCAAALCLPAPPCPSTDHGQGRRGAGLLHRRALPALPRRRRRRGVCVRVFGWVGGCVDAGRGQGWSASHPGCTAGQARPLSRRCGTGRAIAAAADSLAPARCPAPLPAPLWQGFRLIFTFRDNPYFTNKQLVCGCCCCRLRVACGSRRRRRVVEAQQGSDSTPPRLMRLVLPAPACRLPLSSFPTQIKSYHLSDEDDMMLKKIESEPSECL